METLVVEVRLIMNVHAVFRAGSGVLALPALASGAQFFVIAGCESTRTAPAFWRERSLAVFATALVRKGQLWN
jgi:hypothetical protein